MDEAKYGEPWIADDGGEDLLGLFDNTLNVIAFGAFVEGDDDDIQRNQTIASELKRAAACVNATAGIANVEALGALIEASKEACHVLMRCGPVEAATDLAIALAALYAPQASEAKPL